MTHPSTATIGMAELIVHITHTPRVIMELGEHITHPHIRTPIPSVLMVHGTPALSMTTVHATHHTSNAPLPPMVVVHATHLHSSTHLPRMVKVRTTHPNSSAPIPSVVTNMEVNPVTACNSRQVPIVSYVMAQTTTPLHAVV